MFRAVARSSPWLWTSVELTRRLVEPSPRYGDAHAWIRRPGWMRVDEDGRRPRVFEPDLHEGSVQISFASDGDEASTWTPPRRVFPQDPSAPDPVWRPDGLVAKRVPELTVDVSVEYDDPMFNDYQWVAMLDPRELADGSAEDSSPMPDVLPIDVLELSTIQRDGRETFDAVVRPTGAYDPRCACCPLLYCALTDAYEDRPVRAPSFYADRFQVQLDRETGICVSQRDIGGERDGTGFDVSIHQVDVDLPDELFQVA